MFCTFFLVSLKERVKIIGYKQVSPIYYSRGIQWKFYGFSLINKQIIPISCRRLRRTILIWLSAHMFIHIKNRCHTFDNKNDALSFQKVAAKTVAVPQPMRSRWPIPGKSTSLMDTCPFHLRTAVMKSNFKLPDRFYSIKRILFSMYEWNKYCLAWFC